MTGNFPRLFSCLLFLSLLLFVPSVALAASCGSENLYAVVLNGEAMTDGTIVYRDGDTLFIPADLPPVWRLKLPSPSIRQCDDGPYVSLSRRDGFTFTPDPAQQLLRIEAPAEYFEKTVIGEVAEPPLAPPASTGIIVNYDLMAEGGTYLHTAAGGLLEGYLFHGNWNLGSSIISRTGREGDGFTRLETTWSWHDVAQMRTLRVGDSITFPGFIGYPLRYAGVQWRSNFATRPGFMVNPVPSLIGGIADTASAVDLYVNNARVAGGKVPPGPFDIPEIPAVSGAGEVRLVVRDLLGREQEVVQPYYYTPVLLRAGLHDFSVDAGILRTCYGTESDRYGSGFVSGTHRFGISDIVTLEDHVEASSHGILLETGGSVNVSNYGILSGGIAASRYYGKTGTRIFAAYEYRSRLLYAAGSVTEASDRFRDLGQEGWQYRFRRRIVLSGGINLGPPGSFGVVYTGLDTADSRSRYLSGNYTIRVLQNSTLTLTGIYDLSSRSSFSGMVTLNTVLDSRKSAAAYVDKRGEHTVGGFEYQQALPATPTGFAYRLRTEAGSDERGIQGDFLARGDVVDVGAWYSWTSAFRNAYRLNAGGSFILMNGVLKPSRRIMQSFILAEVPSIPGVTVYADNFPVGRTDGSGYLVIPQARPFERNRLSVESEEIPLTAAIDGIDVVALPRINAGQHVRFSVLRQNSATLRITDQAGSPLPVATQVIDRNGHSWMVATDGFLYLNDVTPGAITLSADVDGTGCAVSLAIPLSHDDTISDLGTIVCRSEAAGERMP